MVTPTRLPLNALRVLHALAEHGSMARAAEALNVQPSAVSMQIKNLAHYLGVPLVVKRGRRIELTVHGHELLPAVQTGLARIDDAVRKLRDRTTGRPFTLSVLPSFLHGWLLPRLPLFEARHPSFRLQILTSRELVDVARGAADAAVRLGLGDWPELAAEKLMDEWLVPVCAPRVARQIGQLRGGAVPPTVRLLQSSVDPWSLWSGRAAKSKAPSLAIDDAMAVVTAAESAQGLALARWSLCAAAVKAGRLVAVGQRVPYRFAYYWVYRGKPVAESSSELLRQWLREQSRPAEVA